MGIKKILTKEGLILLGCLAPAVSLFIFLERKFPDLTRLHIKIALLVFIGLYAGRWALRVLRGLMLVLFFAAIAGAIWILVKLPNLHLF